MRNVAAEFHDWLLSKSSVEDAGFTTPCWMWQGHVNPKGYARQHIPLRFGSTKKQYRIHRQAYIRLVRPIASDLVIDHLCRNRACVNPAHLEHVTVAENNARSADARIMPPQTHCAQGHEYEPKVPGQRRRCHICNSATSRARRLARLASLDGGSQASPARLPDTAVHAACEGGGAGSSITTSAAGSVHELGINQ